MIRGGFLSQRQRTRGRDSLANRPMVADALAGKPPGGKDTKFNPAGRAMGASRREAWPSVRKRFLRRIRGPALTPSTCYRCSKAKPVSPKRPPKCAEAFLHVSSLGDRLSEQLEFQPPD